MAISLNYCASAQCAVGLRAHVNNNVVIFYPEAAFDRMGPISVPCRFLIVNKISRGVNTLDMRSRR